MSTSYNTHFSTPTPYTRVGDPMSTNLNINYKLLKQETRSLNKDQSIMNPEQRTPREYEVRVLTLLIAPYKHTLYFPHVRRILDEKYADMFGSKRPSDTIDSAFDRWLIDDAYRPVLYGNTIYGAIKRALGIEGKAMQKTRIHYAVFSEEDVGVYTFKLTTTRQKPSLVNVECLRSGAIGVIVGDLEPFKELTGVDKIRVQIGPMRALGFGYAEIILR